MNTVLAVNLALSLLLNVYLGWLWLYSAPKREQDMAEIIRRTVIEANRHARQD